mgnify:FL=1
MIVQLITENIIKAISLLWGQTVDSDIISIQKTNKEFEGDFTVVVFPLLKVSHTSPEATAKQLGEFLVKHVGEISRFNVIKGFLNLVIDESYWLGFFTDNYDNHFFGCTKKKNSKPILVEYSSPNTNKPLHLGHVRNILLGYSVSRILEANGEKVVEVNLVNDRGIHICKSMLAWSKWGNGEQPASTGEKGDHMVGRYYVMFEKNYNAEVSKLVETGMDREEAEKEAASIKEAQDLWVKWETGDSETRKIWNLMNGWVYQGFDETYNRLGVDFDKIYYESDTYLLGRKLVVEGLKSNVFYQKDDGSVWCDMASVGLDEKLLLRADGTSVYITQDIGTAKLRKDEYDPAKMIYVVGNEQNYHFDILKKILKILGMEWWDIVLHLSYGMVELPHGRMKSREGTVVDADDLLDEMYQTAKKLTEELGKTENFADDEKEALYNMIGLGALKYYILKVDPKKNMLFNPEESIDFNGNTGPFIQYTHARIRSLFRKAEESELDLKDITSIIPELKLKPLTKEVNLLKILHQFPELINEAGQNYSPALVANYAYELAKMFNQFYQDTPILREEDRNLAVFRLKLAGFVGNVIKKAMELLGIEVPERM